MFLQLLPEILRYVTSSVCLVLLFFVLSRPKYKTYVYVIVATAVVILDATVCTIFSVNNKLTEEIFYSIPFYILITCACKWLFKDNIRQWAFNCVTVYTVYAIIFFASFYLGNLIPLYGYGVMLFRVILFALIILFFYKYLRPLYLEVSENWGIFILPLIGLFSTYVYLILSDGHAYVSMANNFYAYCFLTAITILTYIAIIGTILSTKKKQAIREENQRRKENEQLLLNELNAYQEFVKIAKENRHDLRHHNAVLAEFLDFQNIESAKKYLGEYSKSIESGALMEFCKNPLANAVLRVYEKKIIEKGIQFILDAEALSYLPFTIIETSTVLSNILENALEATEKCDATYKFIKLKSGVLEDKLMLEVENTAEEKRDFAGELPRSTKEGGGTGLKSIKSVVDKYDGLLNIKQENGLFVLRLVVEIKQNENYGEKLENKN